MKIKSTIYLIILPLCFLILSACTKSDSSNSLNSNSNSNGNAVPIAITSDDQIVKSNAVIIIDGSKSYDPEKIKLRYYWKMIAKPKNSVATIVGVSANNAISSFAPDIVGEYIVELIVNDGVNNSQATIVYIQRRNNEPIASAGKNRAATINTQVLLDGSGTIDTDDQILKYNWILVSKPKDSLSIISQNNVNDATASFNADKEGEYLFSLTVNDGFVTSNKDTVKIFSYDAIVIYSNDFSTETIEDFTILEEGTGKVVLDNGQLRINPGDTYLNRASISLDTSKLLTGYMSQLSLNQGIITWAFNVSNFDGQYNNTFSFLISNKSSLSELGNFYYSFQGGGFVESRMMLRRSADYRSPFGNVSEDMIDIINGLGILPQVGAIKITFNQTTNEWKLYYEVSDVKLNPVFITTLVGSAINTGFVNENLPYFIFSSNGTGATFYDNFTVLLK